MKAWQENPLKVIMSKGTEEQQAKVINWWVKRDKIVKDLIEKFNAEIIQTEIDKRK